MISAGAASTPKEDHSPRLWPVTIALSVLLWIIATTGGRQVFVKEVLGEAYDSQAEHFLRGDTGVDPGAIRWEAMIVNGKTNMYFGPFPALFRMPLNYVYPSGRGAWSRVCGFSAGVIALVAFAGLIGMSLRSSQLSTRWRNWIGTTCLVGFALGSPLLFPVGSPTLYNEAIIWGFAWSLAALYFVCRSRRTEGWALTRSLLGFSFCVSAALLSRVTFGAPLVLIAPFLGFTLLRKNHRIRNLAVLLLPLGVAALAYLLLNYARFGNASGTSMEHYINPVQREFAQKYGVLNLKRVPYSFVDYFVLRRPVIQRDPPFLKADRFHPYNHPTLYVMPFSETFLSLLWSSSWIVLGAIIGTVLLFRPGAVSGLDRSIAVCLLAQVILILSFMGLAQRYTAELYPFLVFCFMIFLQRSGTAWRRTSHTIVCGLVMFSIVINSLMTASVLGQDGNLPQETRAFWKMGQERK